MENECQRHRKIIHTRDDELRAVRVRRTKKKEHGKSLTAAEMPMLLLLCGVFSLKALGVVRVCKRVFDTQRMVM